MKSQVIALTLLFSLLLTPAFGAARKTSSSNSKPAASAAAEKISGEQSNARKLASDLTTTQKSKMLTLLNEGSTKDLSIIKGVSKTRGTAIEKARPFKSLDEVILVRGIGKGTFNEIISHARSLTARKSSSSKAKAKS